MDFFEFSSSTARFSPSGRLLAYSANVYHTIILFDICDLKSYREFKVSLHNGNYRSRKLEFFNEKYVLCAGFSSSLLVLVDVETCDMLIGIKIGPPLPDYYLTVSFHACRKTRTIVCYSCKDAKPKIMKLWLINVIYVNRFGKMIPSYPIQSFFACSII